MGWFVRHQGHLQEALAQYQELEKEDPRDFRPYLCQVQALSAIFFSTMEAVYVSILMRHVALHGILTHLRLSNCLMNRGVPVISLGSDQTLLHINQYPRTQQSLRVYA